MKLTTSYYFNIILIIISLAYSSIIKVPFKIKKYQSFNNQIFEKTIEDMVFNYKLLSLIELGNPPQKIEALFNQKFSTLYVSNICNNCITFYSYKNSSSFIKIETDQKPIGFGSLIYGNETFYFFDGNNNRKKTVENMLIYLPELDDGYDPDIIKNCLTIGLKFPDYSSNSFQKSFIQQLKSKNIISNYFWTMMFYDNKYDKDYDGAFIFGDIINDYYTNIYNDEYSSDKIVHTYTGNKKKKNNSSQKNILYWGIEFDEVYYEFSTNYLNNLNEKDSINNIIYMHTLVTEFDFDINTILGTFEYYRSIQRDFFDYYYNKSICKASFMRASMYKFIYCNAFNFTIKDLEKFPPLKLKNKKLRYIFTLDYKDLFTLTDNKEYYIFNIMVTNVYKGENSEEFGQWILGLPFWKKYQFSFDTDNKLIYFYNKDGKFLDKIPEDEYEDYYNDAQDNNNIETKFKPITEEDENNPNDTDINNNERIINNNKKTKKYINIKIEKVVLFIILVIIFIFLFLLLLLLIRKILFKKGFVLMRIKKANELNDDDFDYSSNKNINFINKQNKSKKQECEMQIK